MQLIVVPDDRTNDLDDYVRLEDESKEPLSLRDGDVYLSKSSQLVLGIQPGDTAHVQDSSLNVAKVKVSDISLNYLGNTLYMTQSTYERAFGRSVRLNGIFALLKGSSADQIAFSKKLKSDGWLSISSTAEHWENFEANLHYYQFRRGARDLYGGVPVVCGGVYAVQHEYLRARARAGDHQGAWFPPWRGAPLRQQGDVDPHGNWRRAGRATGRLAGREFYVHFADAVAVLCG